MKIQILTSWSSVLAALGASVCCLVPLLSFAAGLSSIAPMFAWLEPFRPYFIALAMGSLGLMWYQYSGHRRSTVQCNCENHSSDRRWILMMIVSIVTVALLALPTLLGTASDPAFSKDKTATATAMITVNGMTCSGCAQHIQSTLGAFEGIWIEQIDVDHGTIKLLFDPQRLTIADLLQQLESAGYLPTKYTVDQK